MTSLVILGWPAAICVAALLRLWGYHLQVMNAPPIFPNLHINLNSLSHRDCYVRVCPCLCVFRPVCMQGCELCVYLLPRYGLSSYVGGEELWKVILPAGWMMWSRRQMLFFSTVSHISSLADITTCCSDQISQKEYTDPDVFHLMIHLLLIVLPEA